MTTVIVGAAGWIGSAIAAYLPDALPVHSPADLEAIVTRVGPGAVIVNAAGRRAGSDAALYADNVSLVEYLLDRAGWLVQLGSAAEYGLQVDSPVTESAACQPTGVYGQSKLLATEKARSSGKATVLRLFNLIDTPPQPGSPIADIWDRIQEGVSKGSRVEVLSGGTTRDYVSREHVAKAVATAVRQRPLGVFNLGSGVPVTVADIASQAVRQLRSDVPVRDLQKFPASRIWADPSAWQRASGIWQRLSAADVAGFLTACAKRHP